MTRIKQAKSLNKKVMGLFYFETQPGLHTKKRFFKKKEDLTMGKRWGVLFVLASSVLLIGCGPKYYRPALGPDKPAEITVSAFTQSGCLECLQEEARNQNVEVKLKEIQTDLGWEIFLFPFYKGYKCIGVVVNPKSTSAVSTGTKQ